MSSIKQSDLFCKSGRPIAGLANVLRAYNCADLKALERLVANCQISDPYLILRYRGNGNKQTPGKLARYLFNLPSKQDLMRAKVEADLGSGI